MDQLKRTLNCLTVENEEETARQINQFITSVPSLELVKNCQEPDTVETLLSMIEVDLLFVNVDQVSPDYLVRYKVVSPRTLLVLLSIDPQYQITISDLNVFDCLIKPLTQTRLQLSLKRVVDYFMFQQEKKAQEVSKKEPGQAVVIKSGGNEHRLDTAEILYIESDGEYVKYHTGKGRFMALGTLKKLAEVLGSNFVQIHRSYVINRAFVVSKNKQNIELTGQRMIPIGKTYKNAFQFHSPAVMF